MSHYNVLFLCTGNSARSIMAEAIMNHKSAPNFTAYSAGSHPSGTVRPAQETCPHWPGQPITAHWGVPDPVAVTGSPADCERAFKQAFSMLQRRISLMLCLPLASLDSMAIKKELDNIGHQ